MECLIVFGAHYMDRFVGNAYKKELQQFFIEPIERLHLRGFEQKDSLKPLLLNYLGVA